MATHVSPEAYLRQERLADTRHEYIAGEVVAMAGGSPAHSRIGTNVLVTLSIRLRGTDCWAFNSDLRVCVEWNRLITYPDIMVICGRPQYLDEEHDTVTNPLVLIEVLSPSTRRYDRSDKALQYRSLPSLSEYLLIEQKPVDVEHYGRKPDGSWTIRRVTQADATVKLESLNIELPVSEIYAGVDAL